MELPHGTGTRRSAQDLGCLHGRETPTVRADERQYLALAGGFAGDGSGAHVAAGAGNGILPDQGKKAASPAGPILPRIGKQALVPLPGNRVLEPCTERFLIAGEKENRA